MVDDDPLLARLIAEGCEPNIREPVMDVEATVKKLGLDSRYRLPRRGSYARQRRVMEICERRGVSPVWRVEE